MPEYVKALKFEKKMEDFLKTELFKTNHSYFHEISITFATMGKLLSIGLDYRLVPIEHQNNQSG